MSFPSGAPHCHVLPGDEVFLPARGAAVPPPHGRQVPHRHEQPGKEQSCQ